jgi:hypothetical protein
MVAMPAQTVMTSRSPKGGAAWELTRKVAMSISRVEIKKPEK